MVFDAVFDQIASDCTTVTLEKTEQPAQKKSVAKQKTFPKRQLWKPSSIVFPVHNQIRAGKEGNFIFGSEASLDASMESIASNKIPHTLYNTRDEGAPIIFTPKTHQWFKIDGDSMNQATPIPIEDKDYVLAIDLILSSWSPKTGDIVIAGLSSSNTEERSGVVKKYTPNGLKSISSYEYSGISLDRVTIRGVVIAVAKPNIPYKKERIKDELEQSIKIEHDIEQRNCLPSS